MPEAGVEQQRCSWSVECVCLLQGIHLQYMCKLCFVLGWFCGIAALVVMWIVKVYNPREYNGGIAQNESIGVFFRKIHNNIG